MDGEPQTEYRTFREKAGLFSRDYIRCCRFLLDPRSAAHGQGFTKKLYSELIGTSLVLEDFLDFHGAKYNQEWFYYRELCAAVRHLGLAGYSQKHILNRLVYYDLGAAEVFEAEGRATLEFLTESLRRLAPAIIEEARRLDLPVPRSRLDAADFPGITTRERLQATIESRARHQEKKHLVKIANEFLNISKHFDQFGFYQPYNLKKIRSLVPDTINEVEVRRYEMLVHNLQSSFDTYVSPGGYPVTDRKLKQLRSFFSAVFHLLQLMGRLLHFYERHLHEAGYKDIYQKVRDRLADLVDPDALLDRTVNFGLYYACHFLSSGKAVAREILNANIDRDAIEVGIPVTRGFHSRPSLLVAKVVQHYGGQVELLVGDARFDASSVLDIQWAGGKIQKENIATVVFEGDTRALRDLEILASVNYGEDAMGNGIPLPKELSYLRQ
jgi:phosphotransferase system HPr-like phosphotransfer protein